MGDADQNVPISILSLLRGQQIRVPSMQPWYERFPQAVSPQIHELRKVSDDVLEQYIHTERDLRRAKASQFELFVAAQFPDSPMDKLQACVLHSIWLFFWDDVIDRLDGSTAPELAHSLEFGDKYREESLRYVRYHLRDRDDEGEAKREPPRYENPFLEFCGMAAEILTRTASRDTVERLLLTIEEYFVRAGEGQKMQVSGVLPTFEEYVEFRMGDSAVYTYCAMMPYMAGVEDIPKDILDSDELRAVWVEANKNVSFSNDIMSLKKEIADGDVLHLIPVLMNQYDMSFEEAVGRAVEEWKDSFDRFEDATRGLRRFSEAFGAEVRAKVETLIDAFEKYQSGCHHWSRSTGRYGIGEDTKSDGSLLIDLQM